MNDKILKQLGGFLDRRVFLKRAATISGSFIAGLLSLPAQGQKDYCQEINGGCGAGITTYCCCTCKNPYVSCSRGDLEDWDENCDAVWSWYCAHEIYPPYPVYQTYRCWECYSAPCQNPIPYSGGSTPCNQRCNTACSSHCCTHVVCSAVQQV
jgi:hypothetical protein